MVIVDIEGKRYTSAGELRVGDKIRLIEPGISVVDGIEQREHQRTIVTVRHWDDLISVRLWSYSRIELAE